MCCMATVFCRISYVAHWEQGLRRTVLFAGCKGDRVMIVLIVEDEPIIALSLARVLENAGHAVIGPAFNREEAVEAIGCQRPDLALIDINLQGKLEGTDLARSLQSLGIPSIFLSAQYATAYANADAALGIIGKPYTAEGVRDSLTVVDTILKGGKPATNKLGMLDLFG